MISAQMTPYVLTTNNILDYGSSVFGKRQMITVFPDKAKHVQTYEELGMRCRKLSSALIKTLSVKPDERIATFATNHYRHVELYYSIPGAAAICHPLNVRLSDQQLIYIINHANDAIVFVDAPLADRLERMKDKIRGVRSFVIMGQSDTGTSSPYTIDYEDLLESGDDSFDWKTTDEYQACGMCYTSGTTGEPKGVLYSHRSTFLHAMGAMSPNAANISQNDKLLIVVPQFHAMAWGFPYVCLLSGAEMVLPTSNTHPADLIDILVKEEVTVAGAVPTIWLSVYQEMKRNPPSHGLKLREIMVGGSPLTRSLIDGFQNDFGISCIHSWGMTETSPVATFSRLRKEHLLQSEELQMQKRLRQGVQIPGLELRIVRESGDPVPKDGKTQGEVQIRGVWVVGSYYREENHKQFTEDGWLRTGDIGTIDSEGYLQITDRSKDLIKSGGEWISSVALETALTSLPSVLEACVIAIPHKKWMERPLACLVSVDETELSDTELRNFLSRDFAPFEIPDAFIYVKELPKTTVGKLDKKELRKWWFEGKLGGSD